ncbi:MAG: TatD family hydrolase [Candidatus Heimdallarchaeaceae archaeon]
MQFYDIHCHIVKNYFRKNLDAFLTQWTNEGLVKVVSMAMKYSESVKNIELGQNYSQIIPGIGIHPWKAKKPLDESLKDQFINLLSLKDRPLVIGEVGLDYHFIKIQERYPYQKQFFTFFLELAEQFHLPVSLHLKGAEKEGAEILTSFNLKPTQVLIHWYSGPLDVLKEFQQRGYYFSINPSVLTTSTHVRVAELVPLEQLLTESDGDVKYIIGNKKIIGSPALIPASISKIADIKNLPQDEIVNSLLSNAKSYLML